MPPRLSNSKQMDDSKSLEYLRDKVPPEETWTIHHGDSRQLRDILSKVISKEALKKGVFDTVITSPPYADLINYEAGDDEVGVGDSYSNYLTDLRGIFQKTYDLTKDSGTMWVVVDDFREDNRTVSLPQDIIQLCENLPAQTTCEVCNTRLERKPRTGMYICPDCGHEETPLDESWRLRDVIVWEKGKGRPFSGEGNFRNTFEYILLFDKNQEPQIYPDQVRLADPSEFSHWWVDWPERYHPRGVMPNNVWNIPAHNRGAWGNSDVDHPAAFPSDLIARMLRYTTTKGDVVFDPFAGSGMVVAQANAMDRRGIGVELNSEFVDAYSEVEKEVSQNWSERVSAGDTLETQQNRLAEVIWGLRQHVYAKKLVQHLREAETTDSIEELGLHTVFVKSSVPEPDKSIVEQMATDFVFVVDENLEDDRQTEYQELLEEATRSSPWTSFGIDATIEVKAIGEVSKTSYTSGTATESRLWLYPHGRHYAFSRRMQYSEWQQQALPERSWRSNFATEKYPPLLSNVSIRVDREGDAPDIEDWREESTDPQRTGNLSSTFTGSIETDLTTTKLTDFSQQT